MSGWGEQLAKIWTNNVAPSRPSCAELCVYSKYINLLRESKKDRLSVLILGSTPEFRDWAFEEDMRISVVDKSESYYSCISRELRHKNLQERLYVSSWETMRIPDIFDVVIGDLSVGNIAPCDFPVFLNNVSRLLSDDGLFLGKTFLWREEDPIESPIQIIEHFKKSIRIHPYTYINHRLGLYCLDKSTRLIDFSKMYSELELLFNQGFLDEEIFQYFKDVGWDTEMKFQFFSPSREEFIDEVNKVMNFEGFVETTDDYSAQFPIYVVRCNRRKR